MVEQGIYFALGCIVTALAAMMFAPVFWSRALRLTRKRLQLQVPLSMQEILAERDQLRAEFAVERLRVEQAADKVHATKAADMAEIGRRSMEVGALRERVAALLSEGEGHSRDHEQVSRELAESTAAGAALRAALDEAHGGVEKWRQRAYQGAEEGDRLRAEIESHRTTIAGLETRAMGLEMRLTDQERSGANQQKASEDGLRARLEAAMGQATRHETSAIALRRECDDAKTRLRALEEDLDAARDREQLLQIQASLRNAQPVRGDERESAPGSEEDLRSSIHALGLAVAMMSRRNGLAAEAGAPDPTPRLDTPRLDTPSPVDAD